MVCRPGHENDPIEKVRHSSAHIMADAVVSLFPGTKVAIGPCIDNGFFYDFESPKEFAPEDLAAIENKMREIIKKNLPFVRKEIPKDEAIEFFKKRDEKFKVEIIQSLPANEPISFYQHGEFIDLCKGPHVEKTGEVPVIKLLSVAGSYWRGDEKRERLQRIYGTAFLSQQDLDDHLKALEEAQKRDHRKLGRELDLFSFHPEAPASPFFHPKGAFVYQALSNYIRKFYDRDGYQEVITPQIIDTTLWKKSGHMEHFQHSMFFTEAEEREMAVKPMNCPGHCLMFGEKKWSYRDLPIRYADFGRLHRFERSGVTHGLTRVRTFAQDDAHIFCTPEQMEGEIQNFIKLVWEIYNDFGFKEVHVALATRPESFSGSIELWNHAEKVLEDSLKNAGISYQINPGEGAFYGPKIEFQIKDALNRPWQLGTLQVDYSMPERFDLGYVTTDGTSQRPVMLHRAVLGSIERFIGILLEHTGGALPVWIAPVQILLIPITKDQNPIALEWAQKFKKQGIRVEVDDRNEKLGLKIREAQLQKIPYMGVVGGKEVAQNAVALRHRKNGDMGLTSVDNLLLQLQKEVNEKS